MLKNLILYRLGPEWPTSADQLVEALAGEPFAPCAATQQKSTGWVPPREEHGALVESVAGHEPPPPANTNTTPDNCTVLPDGSAFAMASYPLPKNHWLYAPREYEPGAEEPKELPHPILTHAHRAEVVDAVRYAIRGATMCGKEEDFDPDALVQNAVYALCGPFKKNSISPPAKPLTFEDVVPMTEAPQKGTWYWVTQPFNSRGVEAFAWGGDEYDLAALRHRMAYLDKEHALIAARHIFGLKGGEL